MSETSAPKLPEDRALLSSAFSAEQSAAENYSILSGCCSAPVRSAFLSLLWEEHRIIGELISEQEKRGWRSSAPASLREIKSLQEKYQKRLS